MTAPSRLNPPEFLTATLQPLTYGSCVSALRNIFAQVRVVRQRMLCQPGQMQNDPKVLMAVGRDLTQPCCPLHNPEKMCEIVNRVKVSSSVLEMKFEKSTTGRYVEILIQDIVCCSI